MYEDIIIKIRKLYDYQEWFKFYIWLLVLFFILVLKLMVEQPWISIQFQYILLIGLTFLLGISTLFTIYLHFKIEYIRRDINSILGDLGLYDLYF